MNRLLKSSVGVAAVLLFLHSSLSSFVTVVPWIEYEHYRDTVVLCALSVAVTLVWIVLTARARQFVRGGLGVLMLLLSGFFLWGNAQEFSVLSSAQTEELKSVDFPSVCAASRKVVGEVDPEGRFVLTGVSLHKRGDSCQCGFNAEGSEGSLSGDSDESGRWSVHRRQTRTRVLPKTAIEDVFQAIEAQDPSVVSNDSIRVFWDGDASGWSVHCWTHLGPKSTGYSIKDDLTEFLKGAF